MQKRGRDLHGPPGGQVRAPHQLRVPGLPAPTRERYESEEGVLPSSRGEKGGRVTHNHATLRLQPETVPACGHPHVRRSVMRGDRVEGDIDNVVELEMEGVRGEDATHRLVRGSPHEAGRRIKEGDFPGGGVGGKSPGVCPEGRKSGNQ